MNISISRSTQDDHAQALYEVAERQHGLFTARQAVEAGFDQRNHPYHVKKGHWLKLYRGIYRLARFPHSDEEQYVLWTLWSSDRKGKPQGVISHASALDLYDLSDYASAKIHLSVPKRFRRSAPVPKEIVLHRGEVPRSDVQERSSYRVTTVVRTLADVILENAISPEFIEQAVDQAFARGWITGSDLDDLGQRVGVTGGWADTFINRKRNAS